MYRELFKIELFTLNFVFVLDGKKPNNLTVCKKKKIKKINE